MKHTLTIALASLALVCAGCGGTDQPPTDAGEATDGPITVDNCGREVTIDETPEDVLVIGGEAGTIVDAAGGAGRVTTFMPLVDEPLGDAEQSLAGAEQMPLQTITDLSREVLVGQAPDLVVTFGLNEFTPEDLEAAGIPTLVIAGYCGGFGAGQSEVTDPIQGIYDDIETLGEVFGSPEVAADSVRELEERVDAVAREVDDERADTPDDAAAVFAIDPDSALGAYGSRSMVHQQMEILGLRNVFAGTDERYFEPSSEAIIDAAPDRVVALYEEGDTSEADARAAVTDRPGYADVPAVQDDAVLLLNFFYSGHGTLAIDGLELLAEQL